MTLILVLALMIVSCCVGWLAWRYVPPGYTFGNEFLGAIDGEIVALTLRQPESVSWWSPYPRLPPIVGNDDWIVRPATAQEIKVYGELIQTERTAVSLVER